MPRTPVFLSLVPALLLGTSTICLAQQGPGAPAAVKGSGIEEVVVTAEKRPENLRDIPASITAIQGQQLEQQGITSQQQLVRMVPGVTWAQAPIDTSRIIIRGAAPGSKGALNDTTSLMIGDVPFENSYAPRFVPDPLPFDLKDVEVLKGPQGTIFGSGSLNGTVRYVYQQPEYGAFHAKYLLEATSIDHGGTDFTEAAMVNIPLGDDFAVRIVGDHRVDPGYNDNLTPVPPSYTSTLGLKDENWRHQDAFRILAGWRPNEQWDVNLSYSYEASDLNGSSVSNNLNGRYQNTNQRIVGFHKYHYSLGELKIVRHFGGFDAVSVTGFQQSHSSKSEDVTASIVGDVSPAVTGGFREAANDPGVDTKAFTQEVRFVSTDPSSPWRWVVGGNYSNQTSRGASTLVNFSDTGVVPSCGAVGTTCPPGLPFPFGNLVAPNGLVLAPGYVSFTEPFISFNWNVRITELAGFANVTRKFFDDKVEVSLGARISHYTSSGVATNRGSLIEATNLAPPGSGLVITNTAKVDETPFSPKVSVTWKPTDSIMVYATASKGFRLGGVQSGWSGYNLLTVPPTPAPLPQTVKSDWLWNYEAGIRTSWLHNTLHVDVTGFHFDWTNAQYTVSNPPAGQFYTTNVGKVQGDGVEGSIQYLLPIDGWSVNASTAYTDIKTAVAFPTAAGSVPAGAQWPGSFRWQNAASLNYSKEFGGIGLHGALSFTSLSHGASPFGDPTPHDLGYNEWNAQLGVNFLESQWAPNITLVVRNLTNDHGLVGSLNDPSISGAPYSYVTYIQPRTFVVQLTKSF